MIQLTERERMLRTYKRQEIDRIMMLDTAWEGTKRRWVAEGMPKDIPWMDYADAYTDDAASAANVALEFCKAK